MNVLTCTRHKTTIDDAGTLLEQNSERYLKSPRWNGTPLRLDATFDG